MEPFEFVPAPKLSSLSQCILPNADMNRMRLLRTLTRQSQNQFSDQKFLTPEKKEKSENLQKPFGERNVNSLQREYQTRLNQELDTLENRFFQELERRKQEMITARVERWRAEVVELFKELPESD